MSTKSKPVYLATNYIPLLETNEMNQPVDHDLENREESNAQSQSCMPSLNNKGKLTNFWLCFILGFFKPFAFIFFLIFRNHD